ncbi:MAG TPA: PilX N-terminal domain-containing pilus assembly protein [Nevskiales bacterium]|nr:PilX N-terminal domain-containing pilus assembly protein [Nevskiales bacterium]
MSHIPRFPRSQSGVILVVGMIVLLVMTLIGLSAARSTLLEERMSGSNTDHNVAFQAAEAALRAGEQSLLAPTLPDFDGTGGRYRAREYTDPAQPPYWKQWQGGSESSNWAANAIAYGGFGSAPAPLSQASARYYLEEFPLIPGPGESLAADAPVDELRFYRVTARGVGISGTTSVILQSTYKR